MIQGKYHVMLPLKGEQGWSNLMKSFINIYIVFSSKNASAFSLMDILRGIPALMKLSLDLRIWILGDYSNPASEIFATKKSICSKPKPSQIFTLPRQREQKSQVDCKLVQKHGSIFLWEKTFNSRRWKLINYLIIGFKSQKYTLEKILIVQARLTTDLLITTMSRAWYWQWTLNCYFDANWFLIV